MQPPKYLELYYNELTRQDTSKEPRNIFTPAPGHCESGDEDVLPGVVEVGEMAGGGGAAEVEIPVEVQEGAPLSDCGLIKTFIPSPGVSKKETAPQGRRPSGAGI